MATQSTSPDQTALQGNLEDESPTPFNCSQCGGCCNQVSILHPKTKANQLLEKPWVQGRFEEFGISGFTAYDDELVLFPHQPDNHCLFLEDNRCLIDQYEGHDAKPVDCRRFPFARPVAGLGELDTSAACITVAEGLLNQTVAWTPAGGEASLDISGLTQEATQPYGNGSDTLPKDGVPLRHGVWEKQFGKKLSASELTDFFASHRETFLSLPPWQALRWWEGQLTHPFSEQAKLASKYSSQPPSLWKRRIMEARFLRQPYGWWSRLGILQADEISDPRVFGRGVVTIPPLEKFVWSAEQESALTAFAWSIAQRKVPLIYGHSLTSMTLAAALAVLLAEWHAAVLANQMLALNSNSETQVLPKEAIVLAFRVVERYYTGHQPLFLERLRRQPFLNQQLAWLLS